MYKRDNAKHWEKMLQWGKERRPNGINFLPINLNNFEKETNPMFSQSQYQRKITCTLVSDIKFAIQQISESVFSGETKVGQVTLDLSRIRALNTDDMNTIIGLIQECDERDIDCSIIKTSDNVYKSLIYASLEFLEVIRRDSTWRSG